ncbi:DUF3575 domain-containing protein [Bacteroides hominis]|uniref:DUF3575 domain-containing protein n=1 Tax=Bacteroides hominis TaxID=2763023 RepID=UPI00164AEBB0|nr:DUF3575 domain-containing protein [Bacteroides hominis (ex Liu et al. 2022)]MBC5614548.1 DUF3575 domain-containing protein [Bacteroides hominis (ex Liu et al. 2022)]
MKQRISLFIFLLYAAIVTAGAQNSPATAPCADSLHVFRFVAANDMFYVPYKGNDRELARLTEMIEAHRDDILARRIPVLVDGWCTSHPDRKTNLRTAATRSNRVKSELILRATLKEDCFVTHNHADAYEGQKDIVTVILRIPVKETVREVTPVQPKDTAEEVKTKEPATPEVSKKEAGGQPAAQQKPEEAVSELPSVLPPPETYRFAVRTNLLYDAVLLPTIGVEWRVSPDWGIKLDGSLAWWGGKSDKIQKVWLLNPEVRRYLLRNRRFYVGASGSYGEYNLYKYPVGSLFSKDTGYQGTMWSAGVTVGYQLCLSRTFSVDFNLGLGYARSEYDSYGMTDGVRVYKAKNQSKNYWGPTQAGINLVWTIGGNK